MSDIIIRGAREHNLDDVRLLLPRNRLICFTGVSGSGKSSLAFDTLYAEGRRRYVESLSSYARQFLGQLPKPDVDQVSGLSPAISIAQKAAGQNVRSTVGTITEISDFLRVLFARVATGFCPKCGRPIEAQTRSQILERLKIIPEGTRFQVLAPLVRNQKGRNAELFASLRRKGFRRVRVDGAIRSLDEEIELDRRTRHSVDVVVDRLVQSAAVYRRLAEAVDSALQIGKGRLIVLIDSDGDGETCVESAPLDESAAFRFADGNDLPVRDAQDDADAPEESENPENSDAAANDAETPTPDALSGRELYFSADYACSHCGIGFERPTPQMFSFNSPQGMCSHCQGLGAIHTFDPKLLIPDETKSFQQGCVVPIGKWADLGRWKRHIYQGVADALEKLYGLEKNYVLETAWEELDERVKKGLLWGTGDLRVTYTWRNGANGHKWGGAFEGIIPKMLKQYRETSNKMQLAAMSKYMSVVPCGYCQGRRLNEQASAFRIETKSNAPRFAKQKSFSLPEISNLSIADAFEFFDELNLSESGQIIARELTKEIRARLGFLLNVGLNYLSLGRSAPTLSGGETQRIRLAGQIGGGLVGVLYVLDEPSIGLHPRDNERLIETLTRLRDLGNTVVVVEHDEDTMLASDYLVDFGPGSGVRGGKVVAEGTVADVLQNRRENSITARFLVGEEKIEIPTERKKPDGRWLVVRGATHHNLKNVDVRIPLGGVVCVTGVSGSGKSSLVNDVLKEALARDLNRANGTPGAHRAIEGVEHLNKLISIDQAPIGRTPRSNPATYIKLFDEIRKLYSETPEARAKGFLPGRFSFNVAGGRCEHCEGNGATKLEMEFLADVWVTCPVCGGRRFNRETTSIKYKGLSIDQALELDVESALKHFENIPKIREKLQTLYDVGLGYMKLGQPSPTLSGGEAQRVKLAKELVKKSSGKTLYLLDEPTTGLHFADIRLLLNVLRNFADAGNTVLIVEHNLDVVKTADWVIDLGPEGGEGGGRVVAEGTPEEIAANPESRTGRALKEFLSRDREGIAERIADAEKHEILAAESQKKSAKSQKTENPNSSADAEGAILVRGATENNLQNISVAVPRGKTTVCCGPSGSGKSSFAIDVLYAEGRRRYVESLSSYARQFLGQIQKPKVEQTIGVSPSIAIEQKTTSRSPRSTVGTVTEIQDYLRVVFARLGVPYCPDCDVPIGTQSLDQIVGRVLLAEPGARFYIVAPLTVEPDEEYPKVWERLRAQGFSRVRVDGETFSLDEPPQIDKKSPHFVEIVVDRIWIKSEQDAKTLRGRVAGSVETALEWGKDVVKIVKVDKAKPERDWETQTMSRRFSCEKCGRAFETLTPRHFSFNGPLGWCPHCEGLGVQTGANPQNFLRDPKLTLAEGAVSLWSDFRTPATTAALRAFSRALGVPLDVPFERLDARFRRAIFSGTGDRWFDVLKRDWDVALSAKTPAERAAGATEAVGFGTENDDFDGWDDSNAPEKSKKTRKSAKNKTANGVESRNENASSDSEIVFRFQFKGIYPATEEAGRLVPYFRGRLEYQTEECECSACLGSRLRDDVSAVRFHRLTLDQICRTPLGELVRFFESWTPTPLEREIAGDLIDEIVSRLRFLVDVGLDYLTLARPAPSLSGGEAQRIRLAAQIGGGLVGVLYVLDEPTIGLHPRDNARLIAALDKLRDLGNTLVIVEHDREVIESADNIIDFGPKAGAQGGLVVASGTSEEVKRNRNSVTGPYLSGEKSIPIPINRRILP